jgi:hypothetical protein
MSDRCPHNNLVWDFGAEYRCDDCDAKAKEIITDLRTYLQLPAKAGREG